MKKIITVSTILLSQFVFAQNNFANIKGVNKALWIQENPEEYKTLSNSRETNEPVKISQVAQSLSILIERPDFPVFVDTGNKDVDIERFEIAKKDWVAKITAINEYEGIYFQNEASKKEWIRNNPNEYFISQ